LGDTPAGYGSVGQSVVVGSDGSSLAFSGVAGGSSTFADLTDTVSSLGNEGQVVVVSGTKLAFSGITPLVSAFSDLTDTPGSLGSAGQSVVVSSDGNSLMFSGVTGGGGTASAFPDLTDTPGSLGNAGQSVVVSSDGNSLIFSGVTGGGGTASAFPDLTDTPTGLGGEGQVVVVSGSGLAFSGITLTSTTVVSGTFSQFTQLIDTPSGIEDGKFIIGSGTGLAFSGFDSLVTTGQTGSFGGASAFTGLSDTPGSLGSAGQSVVVSADGNSLVFSGVSGGVTTGTGGVTTSNSGILGEDLFTGDGVATGFMMTRAPVNDFSITVAVNGLLQIPGNNYDLISGRSGLLFPEAPSSGVEIDVRHLGGLVGPSGEQGPQGIQGESTGVVGALASDLFTGDGSTASYNLTNSIGEAKNIIVSVNGLLQSPVTNYTISGSGLTFPEAPSSGLEIEVRHLAGIRGPSGVAGADGAAGAASFIALSDTVGSLGAEGQVPVVSGSTLAFSGISDSVDLSAVDQNIIPDGTNTRDLGTTGKRWRDLYLSGTSIYLGQQVLQESGGVLKLSTNNGSTFSNVTTKTVADDSYVSIASSSSQAVYDFDSTANFNNTSAAFSDGMLNPATGGRLELDLATGMFIEEYNNTNKIDSDNSSNFAVDSKLKIEQVLNTGDGSDGDVSVTGSSTYTIDQDTLISGRTVADAVSYTLTNLTSTVATCSATVSGIAAGDEVMLYCAQGYSSANTDNWGNYEFLTVDSVSTTDITFTTSKSKFYGSSASADANIGTGASAMKVIVQRVPNYQNLTVANGSTMTCSNYEDTGGTGGKMVFRVGGTLSLQGLLSVSYKGYVGGTSGPNQGGSFREPWDNGTWNSARNYSGGGGRDSDTGGNTPGGGANYANGTAGSCQGGLSYVNLGLITSNTDDSKIFMGGGGGYLNANGGSGGGLAYIHAADLTTYSTADFEAKGTNGTTGGYLNGYGGRGGGGGSFYVTVNTTTLNSTNIDIRAGSNPNYGYNAGIGRFFFKYITLSAGSLLTGDGIDNVNLAGVFRSSATIQSTNILSTAGQVDSINRLLTTVTSLPGGSQATIQFATGTGAGFYWQDATGGSGLSSTLTAGTDTETDLSSLNWSGTNFYYKLTLTGNGASTPEIDTLKLDYDPDLFIGTEQTWTSQALGNGVKRITPTSFTAFWTDDSDNIKPKYQLLGSDTSDFSSINYYPGVSNYYQDGGTYDIDNETAFDLTTAITQYNKYWKVKVYISSGPTAADAPTVNRVRLNANLADGFDAKGISKAWVNFIGVTGGNATITDSLNVNSVSRTSTGIYNVNFSGHFDDTNYMFTAGGYQNEGGYAVMPVRDATGTISVSGYQIAIVSGQNRIDSTGQGVYLSFLGS
jgi:hypothetical protein